MIKSATKRQRKPKEKSNENYKGKIRELLKEVEKWRRYAAYLEKQLTMSPEEITDQKNEKASKRKERELNEEAKRDKGNTCESCGSNNTQVSKLWTPTGERIFINCEDCKSKKRVDVKSE